MGGGIFYRSGNFTPGTPVGRHQQSGRFPGGVVEVGIHPVLHFLRCLGGLGLSIKKDRGNTRNFDQADESGRGCLRIVCLNGNHVSAWPEKRTDLFAGEGTPTLKNTQGLAVHDDSGPVVHSQDQFGFGGNLVGGQFEGTAEPDLFLGRAASGDLSRFLVPDPSQRTTSGQGIKIGRNLSESRSGQDKSG